MEVSFSSKTLAQTYKAVRCHNPGERQYDMWWIICISVIFSNLKPSANGNIIFFILLTYASFALGQLMESYVILKGLGWATPTLGDPNQSTFWRTALRRVNRSLLKDHG